MSERDRFGRFSRGNGYARLGGLARAASMDAVRRTEIARAGWDALVAQRFGGNEAKAKRWFAKLGAWASDAAYRDLCPKFQHPGPCPEKGAK